MTAFLFVVALVLVVVIVRVRRRRAAVTALGAAVAMYGSSARSMFAPSRGPASRLLRSPRGGF